MTDSDFPLPGEVGEQFLRLAVNTLGEAIADYVRRASLPDSGGFA